MAYDPNKPDALQTLEEATASVRENFAQVLGGGALIAPIFGNAVLTTANFNDLVQPGFYNGYDLTNAPLDNEWFYILVQRHHLDTDATATWVHQIACHFGGSTGAPYVRVCTNGTWTSWAQLATGASGQIKSGCRAYVGSNTQISNTTITALALNNETYDHGGWHDNATNNSRFTVPTGRTGLILFTGAVGWSSTASGYREVYLYKNGNAVDTSSTSLAIATEWRHNFTFIGESGSVGDYFEIRIWQNSSGNLNIIGGDGHTYVSMSWLGA